MKLHHSILLVMGCLFYNVASAEQPGSAKNTALFTKYNCLVCHNPTGKRKAGPSFKMVADRYAGNAQAVDMLVKKVRSGGSGSWGPMPMPAIPAEASDAEIKLLVTAVLATQ
ncbi:MAG: hypothetical protein COZ20_05175 [Gallionellales bacterium CG_4_10_14_3_um_filter_54_96]|nr:MAG: hypothetical protein COZ20_05175 [Gallionellales bacterium CG_4_10_14_3_um_filter_54_96]